MLLIAVLSAMLLFCAGCGKASRTQSRTVTDMTGREIALNGDVTRVVALTAADCEILYAVGAGDALVGRGEYCDYPEAALSLPAVQSGAATNVEQIVALSPQVVFMDTMAQSVEQIAALEAAGIQVVVSEATDLEGVYESISVIGRVMNRESEAADVIAGMKQTFQQLSDKAAAFSDKPTVYFEISPLKAGLWTAGKGTFMDEAASLLGAQNVFGDVLGRHLGGAGHSAQSRLYCHHGQVCRHRADARAGDRRKTRVGTPECGERRPYPESGRRFAGPPRPEAGRRRKTAV